MAYFVRTRQGKLFYISLFTLRAGFNRTIAVLANGRSWLGAGPSSNTSAHLKYADIKVDIDIFRFVFANKWSTGPHEREQDYHSMHLNNLEEKNTKFKISLLSNKIQIKVYNTMCMVTYLWLEYISLA